MAYILCAGLSLIVTPDPDRAQAFREGYNFLEGLFVLLIFALKLIHINKGKMAFLLAG